MIRIIWSVNHCILRVVIRYKSTIIDNHSVIIAIIVVDNNLRMCTTVTITSHMITCWYITITFQDEDVTREDKVNILNIVIVG